MTFYVYIVTNAVNGKRYVGVTEKGVPGRWRGHCHAAAAGSPYLLHKAIRKYGRDAFRIEIAYEATSRAEMIAVERGLIAQYGTCRAGGYNWTSGGEGPRDHVHSAETRAKMRAAWERRKARPEYAAYLLSRREAGKVAYAERREAFVGNLKGKKRALEDRANRAAAITAWHADRKARGLKMQLSPEGLAARRSNMLGNQHTKGRKVPPEEKARRVAAIKAAWARKREMRDGA